MAHLRTCGTRVPLLRLCLCLSIFRRRRGSAPSSTDMSRRHELVPLHRGVNTPLPRSRDDQWAVEGSGRSGVAVSRLPLDNVVRGRRRGDPSRPDIFWLTVNYSVYNDKYPDKNFHRVSLSRNSYETM